LKLFFLSRLLT